MEPTWYEGVLRRKAVHLRKTLGKRTPSCGSSALPSCTRPDSQCNKTGLSKSASEPAAKQVQVWRVVWEGKVGIRETPEAEGRRTGDVLYGGEVFQVRSEQRDAKGVLFLELADGRGWVFATKAEVGTVCRREATVSNVLDFVERQSTHHGLVNRMTMSSLKRKLNVEQGDLEESAFLGAQGSSGLRTFLVGKFGTVAAGWRALDAEGRGHISFYEFCNACRKLGFHGNMRTLWKELDVKCQGSISLAELDAEAGQCVEQFKKLLTEKYGDLPTAWKEGPDLQGSGAVEEKAFVAFCQRLGAEVPAKRLFRVLTGRSGHGLTLADLDGQEAARRLASAKPATAPKDPRAGDADGEAAAEGARSSLEDFRRALVVRKGSLLAGWRESMDLNHKGHVGFVEFCQAFQRLNLRGDMRALFNELDAEKKGHVTFADLDKDAAALLSDFFSKLDEVYGNSMLAWVKCLDRKGAGCVSKQNFIRACEKVGFAPDVGKRLFRILRPEAGRQNLTMRDFDPKAYNAFTRGDFRMLSESENPRKAGGEGLLEMDFQDRQRSSLYLQLRKGWDTSERAEFARACLGNVPKHAIDTAWEFEELCKRKFGSLIAAWRNGLDTDGNGKLTFNEFCKQCRLMGYVGNLKTLWAGYGGETNGCITLRDLDAQADALVNGFLGLLNERYGSLEVAWRKGFGKDPHDGIDEQELSKGCQALGYAGSHKKLFRSLRRTGANLLTIWDLDPTCQRSRARVQMYKSEAKLPEAFAGAQSQGGDLLPGGKSKEADEEAPQDPLARRVRAAMRHRHGSTVASWRACFGCQEKIGFYDFLRLMGDIDYDGLRRDAWQEVAGEGASVTFKEMDPGAQRALDLARASLLERYGSLLRFWSEGLHGERKGRVDEAAFLRAGEQAGLKAGRKVLALLFAYEGQCSLVQADLRSLLIGLPAGEQASAWGEEAAADSEPCAKEHTQRALEDFRGRDFLVSSLETFKQGLVVRFGSLFAAWRKCFDLNHNGTVSKAEFSRACNQLGIKAVKALWTALDASQRGRIVLREFDPEGGEAFEALEEALVQRYGSVQQGWSKAFELSEPPSIHVEQAKFMKQCEALGVPGNPSKLFRLLKPAPGRKYLIYEDMWRASGHKAPAQERSRGRLPAVEPPQRADSARHASPRQNQLDELEVPSLVEPSQVAPPQEQEDGAKEPSAPTSPEAAATPKVADATLSRPPTQGTEADDFEEDGAKEEEAGDDFEEDWEKSQTPSHVVEAAASHASPKEQEAVDEEDDFEPSRPPSRAAAHHPQKAHYEDAFSEDADEAPTPAASPKEDAASAGQADYEDDFAEEDVNESSPQRDAAEKDAEADYEDDFAEEDDESPALKDFGEGNADGSRQDTDRQTAEASYEDDFSEEDRSSPNPQQAKEASYEDDFPAEGEEEASRPTSKASSRRTPSGAASEKADYEDDFDDADAAKEHGSLGSRPASSGAASRKAEEEYSDDGFAESSHFSQSRGTTPAGRAAQPSQAGEEYSDDGFAESSHFSQSRGTTPAGRVAQPSQAEEYSDDGFESHFSGSKRATPVGAAAEKKPLEVSQNSEDEDDYSEDGFQEPPATGAIGLPARQESEEGSYTSQPSSRKAAVAKSSAEPDYNADSFVSDTPSSRLEPNKVVKSPSSGADEAYDDDDFASSPPTSRAGVEESPQETSAAKVPPRSAEVPATASTMPPSSPWRPQADLGSTTGSRQPFESTGGSQLPDPERRPFSPLREETEAPESPARRSEAPPLRVSEDIAKRMEQAKAERQQAQRAEKEAALAGKVSTANKDEEAPLYEDDFDPSSNPSLAVSRRQSSTAAAHTPKQDTPKPPTIAELLAAKAAKEQLEPGKHARAEAVVPEAAPAVHSEEEAVEYEDDFDESED